MKLCLCWLLFSHCEAYIPLFLVEFKTHSKFAIEVEYVEFQAFVFGKLTRWLTRKNRKNIKP